MLPLLEDKWPGLELGHETASEQSQLHGILGEQDLRPLTHRVTLKGRTASDCPSSRPLLAVIFVQLDSPWLSHSLGSASRMQTRQHKRLVLNPKRAPPWAPSHGNVTLHTVHPTGIRHLEDGERQGAFVFSTQTRLLSGRAVPGLLVRTSCFGVLLLPRNLPVSM